MEARYCLNVLPHGPSSLRVYADTQEMHERISIGIFGTVGGDGGFLGPMQLVAVEVDHEVENQRLNGKKEMEKAEVFGEAIEPDSADESSDVTPDLKYYRAQDILRVRRRVERSTALRARHEKEKEKNGKDVCLERTVLEPGVDRKRKRETTPSIEDARDTRP